MSFESRVAELRASLASRGYKLVQQAGDVKVGQRTSILGISAEVLHLYRHPDGGGIQAIVRRDDNTPGVWWLPL